MKFQGAIFDVDGTLVDSNDAHAQAFVEAFREFGCEVPFAQVRRLIGKGSDKLIPELIGRYDPAIAERKKAIFKERQLPKLRAFPRVQELLEAVRSNGLKLAVASSAAEDELDALLEVAHAKRYFEQETDADDAERSKPDPDIVQAALRKLALRPTTPRRRSAPASHSSGCAAADGAMPISSRRPAFTTIPPRSSRTSIPGLGHPITVCRCRATPGIAPAVNCA